MTKLKNRPTLRASMVTESAKKWEQWRTRDNPKTSVRELRAQAQLEGVRLTKAELLAAGHRPKRDDKIDLWGALTKVEQQHKLAASKAHMEAQLSIGVSLELIYGPWTVLHNGARWEDKLSKSTLD